MGLNPTEQKTYDDYRARMSGCEADAIASSFATCLIFSHLPEDVLEKLFAEIKENSRIIRHNKRVSADRKKIDRVQELNAKKRMNSAEKVELLKLAKQLGFKGEM